MFTVNVSVANLRREPGPLDLSDRPDRKQESQLLFGETVEVVEKRDGWVRVRAIEQDRFHPDSHWTGYPGWIKEEELSQGVLNPSLVVTALYTSKLNIPLGSYLEKVGETGSDWIVKHPTDTHFRVPKSDVQKIPSKLNPDRQAILKSAEKLLGHRYRWGGRCPFHPEWKETFTSVDCSGLANLAYRVEGLSIPRDAHDQYLISEALEPDQLKAADLIFLAPIELPHRMTHVMLYIDGDHFIDSNITDGKVVQSTGKERFGLPFHAMANKIQVQKYFIHFGRPLCLKA